MSQGAIPYTRYVPAHIPSPRGRLSRPQSSINVSDSLYAIGLPRLFLFGLPELLQESRFLEFTPSLSRGPVKFPVYTSCASFRKPRLGIPDIQG
jgi:hypothetical protein